jgi:DNA (cytosine-5)-methyltransferase 1
MIRMGDSELQLLDTTAKANGLPTATWARMELLRVARNASEKAVHEPSSGYAVNRPELLSLFCGCGGLDEGFRQAGFATRLAIDIDQECVNTFAKNHTEAKAYRRDLTELKLADIKSLSDVAFNPRGVLGGPPCQSFSVSNVHQREDDPRHSLPSAYAKLLKAINGDTPISFFVFENVPGLLGERHRHRYDQFKREFSRAGFQIYDTILDAQNYGVPQVRPRVFIVGINRDLHRNAEWR